MKKLYILAPNDRFNYGDLLFPHILKFYFEKHVDECVFVSTTESDLSQLGGIPTKPFSELYKVNPSDENILIVAGGECLMVHWFLILAYVDPFLDKISKFLKKIHLQYRVDPIVNFIAKRRWNFITRFPFSIGKNELQGFSKVIYNSLGKCSLSIDCTPLRKTKNISILKSVDYLAVRDSLTYNALRNAGITCSLAPDSAISMSWIFSEKILKQSLSIDVNSLSDNGYIFFQTSPLGNSKEIEIASFLEKISIQFKKKIVLCPIGTALGHSNQVALKNIYNRMSKDFVQYFDEPNVWDIMWLIKHSCLYVGSSLHGLISAMSHHVPFAVHGQLKLKAYIDTWCPKLGHLYSNFDGLKINIKKQITDPIICDVENQNSCINESLHRIEHIICEQ